ncbi:hypothetical protein [Erythrobacter sp.]|uniref:hypothetical protein n=1 Tax=Erythrobacter sp. TaxID=1042 RepID=UPI0031204850
MSELRTRMVSDRHLRDTARALVEADVENLKTTYSQKSLTTRAMDKARESAVDIYEEALEVADDNRGALAALVAAIVVWFARNPILSLFGLGEEDDPAPDDANS